MRSEGVEASWGLDAYEDEGKANQLLIHFFSSLMDISYLNLSLGLEDDGFALRIEGMDYEEVYLRIKDFVPWFTVCWMACFCFESCYSSEISTEDYRNQIVG